MDSKMLTSQEQSKQLENKELEAVAGGRLNNLLKHLSLRGKVARWAAVAASVGGISVGMVMPAHAINRSGCERDTLNINQGRITGRPTMCFANAGEIDVIIADVHRLFAGNNAGYVETNKGRFDFRKHEGINFIDGVGTVTIKKIGIY